MLVKLGYKEIEVSIPSASDTDWEFTRQLVDTPEAVPDDVWLQVLCPCRLELIERTVRSLKGAKKVILSLYVSSSENFLKTVWGLSQQAVYDKVVESIRYAKSITKDDPSQRETTWNLMFSPEAFSDTELSYSLRLCEAAKSIWEPSIENPIILNLPGTVEMSTPNVYADQVEMFSRSISDREKVCVSLHPHNDRGCSVAAAELGQMAGAQRVEGCLFGNGERAGNVDLVTLALNLYSQGIEPGVDLSNLPSIRATVEECTKIKVHARQPYSGDLIFTAYSGAHQDAIGKGIARMRAALDSGGRQLWKVPYLGVDPRDLGSNLDAVIRLNSQSGTGGVAWTLSRQLQTQLPKGLQMQYSKAVKKVSEERGGVLSPADIGNLFLKRYFVSEPDPRILFANIERLDKSFAVDGLTGKHNDRAFNGGAAHVDGVAEVGKSMSRAVDIVVKLKDADQRLRSKGVDITNAVQNALALTSIGTVTFHHHKCDMHDSLKGTATLLVVECRSDERSLSTWGARRLEDAETTELFACLSSALVRFLALLARGRKANGATGPLGAVDSGSRFKVVSRGWCRVRFKMRRCLALSRQLGKTG